MIYLSGVIVPHLPAMASFTDQRAVPDSQPWAADNGRYSAPQKYDDTKYLAWLARMPVERCLFATAPDVVGDAVATLELSRPMFGPIRSLGYRVALVGQDGLEDCAVPWGEFDVFFIGGTTAWKLSPVVIDLVREAKQRAMWVHMGRVNSRRRYVYADAIGCDSADGTILKHDPRRDLSEWVRHVDAHPSIWRQA